MKSQKINIRTGLSITVLACVLTALVTCFLTLWLMNQKLGKYSRLRELDNYVKNNYYLDLDEETEQAVMDTMLKGYVSGLGDRYSQYLTPEEYQAFMTKESGKTVGIGITVIPNEEGYPKIIEVQENSPAEQAGLQVDDVLIAIEGQNILEYGYTESIENVKGEEDTTVHIAIQRNGTQQDYDVVRKTFDIVTVQSQMLENQIGYIRITSFRENTVEQFLNALEILQNDGAKGLIFDVRDNGGGLLDSLEKMLDPLLPEGIIATATYHGGVTETVVESDANEIHLPMVVLVNQNSASAAELFSASLRDFKQAKLVGTQTFGKGVMQVTARMQDGGGLSLTVATYQTSVSECYHGVGLAPDVVVEASEDFILVNEANPDTDLQLASAMELIGNELK